MNTNNTSISTVNRLEELHKNHHALLKRKNFPISHAHGLFTTYKFPVVTAQHVPLTWRFDLNPETNENCLERIGVNAAFNAGAIKWNEKYVIVVRVEGKDRKSYFAFAESENGIDNFQFWDEPLFLPQNEFEDTNVYDMRLTKHEDGYIYGVFCTERKDPAAEHGDTSSAIANAGIIRSKDLICWERLPDLKSTSQQQRNVVIHPEFVNGKYAIYTRPQDGFIETGAGGGIGLGYVSDMRNPVISEEVIINPKLYHTVYESKNGQGPAPIKTAHGWLHLAHGVRNTAAGLRYVLYLFMTDLDDISKVIHQPAGYFMAPMINEMVGDVGNVLFSNGWIVDEDGKVFIYYASADTRLHLATTTTDILIDYCLNTPEDKLHSNGSVENILRLIEKNRQYTEARSSHED